MKIPFLNAQNPRITVRRSFHKEYLLVLLTVLISSAGAVLIFDHEMRTNMSSPVIAVTIISYILFICFLVSLVLRIVIYQSFRKPMLEIGTAAQQVASGDFSVRLRQKRKDDKMDELEVLIEDFNKMVQELATIETMKTDFIGNISHEMKTPISIIRNYSEALRNVQLQESVKMEYIETIIDSADRLSSLVTDVLKLNTLENQEIIHKKSYSLSEQLRLCLLFFEDRLNEKEIDWSADLDEEIVITNDEGLLGILWSNLISNAVKFTDRGGALTVSAQMQNRKVIVRVEDTGCGMSEETVRKIFDRFYQGDTSHTSEGNGIGMSIAHRIIKLTNASLTIDSTLGKGSSFMVELPIS
ncbi:MAG: ATP-binding protein [Lachnospiraceae bacterium]